MEDKTTVDDFAKELTIMYIKKRPIIIDDDISSIGTIAENVAKVYNTFRTAINNANK